MALSHLVRIFRGKMYPVEKLSSFTYHISRSSQAPRKQNAHDQ